MTHIMTHASNGTKTHLSHKFSTQFIMLFVLTSVTCSVFSFFINLVLPVFFFNAYFLMCYFWLYAYSYTIQLHIQYGVYSI